MPSKIKLANVCYSNGAKDLFKDVSLEIGGGGVYALVGTSGSGKSTLLEVASGLKKANSGTVLWDGQKLSDFSRAEMTKAKQQIGFMFQQVGLISNLTVKDNIALPIRYHKIFEPNIIEMMVDNHLKRFGIEHLAGQLPELLSNGEARLVSIARALIMIPKFLFLDEPLTGLDPATAKTVLEHLYKISNKEHVTIFMVTHHLEMLSGFDYKLLILENRDIKMFDSLEKARENSEINSIIHHSTIKETKSE
jgi:ABC-type methionine transport system ATPase subunit